MADAPFNRTEFPGQGARLDRRDFDVRSEAGARSALEQVNRLGTLAERAAVNDAVKRFWPRVFKDGTARSHFPNSNMKP